MRPPQGRALKRAALLFGLCCAPLATFAAEWRSLGSSIECETFLDSRTSLPDAQGRVAATLMQNFHELQALPNGKAYRSMVTEYRLQCSEQKIAIAATTYHEGAEASGRIQHREATPPARLQWNDPPAGSLIEGQLPVLCHQAEVQALYLQNEAQARARLQRSGETAP